MVVFAGCQEQSYEDSMAEGRISGPPDGMNRSILMQSDSLTGESFSTHVNRHQLDNYSTSSYFLHVSKDTKIEKPSGEELIFGQIEEPSAVFNQNQYVTVKANHTVTEDPVTPLPRYVTFQPKFLPVVDADHIQLHPLSPTDIADYYIPLDENQYHLLVLTDNVERTADNIEIDLQLFQSEERIEPTFNEVDDHTLHFMDTTEMLYLLDDSGILIETGNIQDLYHYFNITNEAEMD